MNQVSEGKSDLDYYNIKRESQAVFFRGTNRDRVKNREMGKAGVQITARGIAKKLKNRNKTRGIWFNTGQIEQQKRFTSTTKK